jgi:uncharacterized repeat protein (TIGR03806 family)
MLAISVTLVACGGCDGGGEPSDDAGADVRDDAGDVVEDAPDTERDTDTTDGGDASDTDTGSVDGPGLDERPSNATCTAPPRPPTDSTIELEPAFPNLSFTDPVWMSQPPGDASRWYVISQTGRILTFPNDAQTSDTQVALEFSDGRVIDGGERGMLGMAFHPDWPNTKQLFISYTLRVSGQLTSRISRVDANADGITFDTSTEQVILEVAQPAGNHNGGQISFGPDDMLYIGLGDGGGADDVYGNGQNIDTLLGTILRIDVLGGDQPYGIPSDNPFVGTDGADEIYAWGLRNPWRFSFDRATGELWAGDVGQNAWEEVDIVELGGNYGWPAKEGTHCFDVDPCEDGPWIDPVVEYQHQNNNRSITGGYVYRGNHVPSLVGSYVYADFASGRIWRATGSGPDGTYVSELMLESSLPVSSFAESNNGELYVVSYGGGLYKVADAGGQQQTDFPQTLTATGCVDPDDPTKPAAGLIPYRPNAPFWSDGADKHRWMALPDGENIEVESDGDWSFPAGTVLVKSFELDGRFIETRLFIHHEDGWAGYTYEWNEAQTEANLLQSSKVVTYDGPVGPQDWIYPSRGECMQCHTSAAGFSLGLESAQLNTNHDYPSTGRRANQLETLRHIGVLDGAPNGDVESLPVLPDPFGSADQADRARSYMHTNCSQCHRPEASSVRNQFDVRFGTPLADANICDVEPLGYDLGLDTARRLVAGDPSNSMIYRRSNRRDAHAMPPIGSNRVDVRGVELLQQWVRDMDSCQ